jgi:ADP-ribosyl-[dinitrogen reductase] hydrolase
VPSLEPAASSVIDRALAGLVPGEPRDFQGLTVLPLLSDRDDDPSYDPVSLATAAGTFRITEVSATGVVGRLKAVNEGARPVLLLDGEEVVGAKQNRVINLTVVVAAHTELEIPVSCVEQGRWHAQSHAFRDTGRAMFARGRANKARHVTQSLRARGDAAGDQQAVWSDVAMLLHEKRVRSSTGAMGEAFEAHRASIDEFVEAFEPAPRQVGAVFGIGGDVIGVEFFDTPAAYRASAPKLIRSYAAELAGKPVGRGSASKDAALALVDEVRRAPVTRHRATGLGESLRIDQERLTGGALALDEKVIHFFAFRTTDPGDPGPGGRREPTLAQQLIRDGVMHCRDARTFDVVPPPVRRSRAELHDRIHGMLIGLAVGDALGNTTEGWLPARRRAEHGEIRDYLPNAQNGERTGLPSDDTQLAFWTLRRLLEDDGLVPGRVARDFLASRIWGEGGTVRQARSALAAGAPWHQAGQPSAGNGALMRIAPVLLPHLREPSPRLWSDAAVAGMITHNEPGSIAACVAFTRLLWELLRRRGRPRAGWLLRTFVETLRDIEGDVPRYEPRAPHLHGRTTLADFTERHVTAALRDGRDTLAALDSWHSGAFLLETVPSVLFILERHGHDPAEAISRAVNDTKDNDTVAAIVGAAVGALHGRAALPDAWVRGLLGRTRDDDDGAVFTLAARAAEAFAGPAR